MLWLIYGTKAERLLTKNHISDPIYVTVHVLKDLKPQDIKVPFLTRWPIIRQKKKKNYSVACWEKRIGISGLHCFVFEPGHEKMCLMSYANNKGADQPAHPRRLISAFVFAA